MKNVFNGNAKKIKQDMNVAGLKYGISMGRRAPMHRMHVDCIMEIVAAGLKPVIFIGSTNGPASPLYDPVRNPLTVEQQKEQLCCAMPGLNLNKDFVITMDDELDDKVWLDKVMQKVKETDLYQKSAVHFRSKSADNVPVEGNAKPPLRQYVQAFVDEGLSVWQSYNQDPADDNISASEIRLYDLENLTDEQRNVIAAPDYMIELARAARQNNPDRQMLADHGQPLTMLDLTFERLRLEVGVSTASIIEATIKNHGAVTHASLIKEINNAVKLHQLRAINDNEERKPLLVIGNNVSSEMAETLKQDGALRVVGASIGKFQSDEAFTELFYGDKERFESNAALIKGAKAFVVQSTAEPVSDNLQHLLEMIHTLKRHGAEEVTAVITFAAFARQDRDFDGRFSSVAAELMPLQLKAAGADKVITFTMHSQASAQFYKNTFGDNFVHLSATDVFAEELRNKFYFTSPQIIVGAPDGADKPLDEGQKRARELSEALTGAFNAKSMFRVAKVHVAASETKITTFDGDVRDKDCVVVDDMVDGGSTMINAAKLLKEHGAKSVTCCCTHAILTPGAGTALERMMTAKDGASYVIDRFIMADTVPDALDKLAVFAKQYPELAKKVQVASLGSAVLAEIKRQLAAAPASEVLPKAEKQKPGM